MLSHNPLQPFQPKTARISRAKLDSPPLELPVEREVCRLDFDFHQGLLIAWHGTKVLGDVTAWRLDTGEPASTQWGIDSSLVAGHQLMREAGVNLEIDTALVPSQRAPQGTYLHVTAQASGQPLLLRKIAHLIWDARSKRWVSGIVAGALLMACYEAGAHLLAMRAPLGKGSAWKVRVIPVGTNTTVDFDRPPFSVDLLCWGVQFGAGDQYVVLHGGPIFKNEKLEEPLRISVYDPASTRPVWQQTHQTFGPSATEGTWGVRDVALTAEHALLGILSLPKSAEGKERFALGDLVAGRALSAPFSPERPITVSYGAAARRALMVYLREPNVLELIQFGRSDPVVLRLELSPEEMQPSARPQVQLSKTGDHLAVFRPKERVLRLYRLG